MPKTVRRLEDCNREKQTYIELEKGRMPAR